MDTCLQDSGEHFQYLQWTEYNKWMQVHSDFTVTAYFSFPN
jgi:hypothetical protein